MKNNNIYELYFKHIEDFIKNVKARKRVNQLIDPQLIMNIKQATITYLNHVKSKMKVIEQCEKLLIPNESLTASQLSCVTIMVQQAKYYFYGIYDELLEIYNPLGANVLFHESNKRSKKFKREFVPKNVFKNEKGSNSPKKQK